MTVHTERPARAPETEGAGGAAEPDLRGVLDMVPGDTPPPVEKGHPAGVARDPKPDAARRDAAPKPQRPPDVPEKFWDAEAGAVRVDALLKAYRDAERALGRGEHKPPPTPDGYALPKGDGIPEGLVKPDDPLWRVTIEAAHKRGMSQADLDAIAAPFLRTLAELTRDRLPPDPEAERAARRAALEAERSKLGPQADAIIAGVGTWLRGLHARGVLAKDELDSLFAIADAAGVRAFAKLREMAGEQPLGVDPAGVPEIGSEREARALIRRGYGKGEDTEEGRELIARGRQMLEALQRAGVKLNPSGGGLPA